MRAVVQRVKHSSVIVDEEVVGKIGPGFMVLLGVEKGDTEKDMTYIADKLLGLRIFEDEEEKMNLSIQDVNGEMLIVSQFTLLADCRKGRRPSFSEAARPDEANDLYMKLVSYVKESVNVETGVFQADMQVDICNDGPVTVMLDSKKRF
ncbi:D-tyrosyl-tRNA(Tyr) deacylase [Acidaminobacter sp. JC074]|uniref:D-aminoacyl-tRNA deacylase n=1 Tax=Acidaminobacter sp. JC074 TaxID=2530199 RepID=UPI001F0CF878|nr:D-aminoacyl-tRNA deacylase [Acidaminobacter sp. JC074]MCH4888301.1 D-tyrosyl-tRNA(Tyr) deacylase [Acidaminobacter sp. JC074]